jgi:hypothetical protein
MNDVRQLSRRRAPFERPQSVAWSGNDLWVGSIATERVYRLDPVSLRVLEEAAAPGKPWGMTAVRGELRVICGEPPDDNRFIRTLVPGRGFQAAPRLGCPDDTGSQLSFDGRALYVSQWYNRRILELDEEGKVRRVLDLPHQICGQTYVEGSFYALTTEDEKTNDYWITRIEASGGVVRTQDLARVPFAARALAFDGSNFWTNHREAHEIVTFALG